MSIFISCLFFCVSISACLFSRISCLFLFLRVYFSCLFLFGVSIFPCLCWGSQGLLSLRLGHMSARDDCMTMVCDPPSNNCLNLPSQQIEHCHVTCYLKSVLSKSAPPTVPVVAHPWTALHRGLNTFMFLNIRK